MSGKNSALIVDDDTDLCFMLSEIFRSKNIAVAIAHSIFEAKKEISKTLPTIVILDNTLPDGKGSDFVHYLVSNIPSLKIFFISGDYENEEESTPQGVIQFIRKPFTLSRFRSVIDSHMDNG